MVGQMDTNKFIAHPKDWADSLPDLKRRNADLDKQDNLSWVNESPYKNVGYKEESLRYGHEGPWGFHANTRLCEEISRSGITKSEDYTMPDDKTTIEVDKIPMKSALDHQENGTHYQTDGIQPITFITSNNLSFVVGNAIKYLFRADKKGGAGDLYKAIHYIRIELETKYGIRSEVKYQE